MAFECFLTPSPSSLRFELSARVAQVLMTIYATLLYSAGMPLLLPVAALNLAIGYASDKSGRSAASPTRPL